MIRGMKDRIADSIIAVLRPIINVLISITFKYHHSGLKIKKYRKPFIIVGNHVTDWDSFFVMRYIKHRVRFVATEITFLDFLKNVSMGYMARSIKKRVGKPDMRALKNIFSYLRKGYAIGLFPEGDNTFYGETLDTYQSTGKLVKRAGVDVILALQRGGYSAIPRWADYSAKKGNIYLETSLLLKSEDIAQLSAEEIQERIDKAIYHNEADWQKENKISYKRKNSAEGIERVIYRCNNCGSILTVAGKKDEIVCTKCGVIGTVNEYGLIEDNAVDNLAAYIHEQFEHIEEVANSTFQFPVRAAIIELDKLKSHRIGDFLLRYENKKIILENEIQNLVFDMEKIQYPVNTQKNSFSFDYEGQSYNFTNIRHQFVLYELCRYFNGSYKI